MGTHIAVRSTNLGPVTHVFSSDLQRAVNTAQAVIDAQTPGQTIPGREQVRLVKVPELRERDFGSAEGKRFGAPRADAETHEGMRRRADRFVATHVEPLLRDRASKGERGLIVVVSHGLLLNSLLRVLLTRYAPGELARLAQPGPGPSRSEYLASWSNTGYLEMTVGAHPPAAPSGEPVRRSIHDGDQHKIKLAVVRVNSLTHLEGLKKTRGGIGSAQFDSRQRTVDSFFAPTAKKRKVEEKD